MAAKHYLSEDIFACKKRGVHRCYVLWTVGMFRVEL